MKRVVKRQRTILGVVLREEKNRGLTPISSSFDYRLVKDELRIQRWYRQRQNFEGLL